MHFSVKSWQFCKRMANKAEIVLAQHANQCQNIVHLAHFCTSTIFFIHRNIVACRYCNSSGLAFFAGWQMHHILIFHTYSLFCITGLLHHLIIHVFARQVFLGDMHMTATKDEEASF